VNKAVEAEKPGSKRLIKYRRCNEARQSKCVSNKALTITWSDSQRMGGEGLAPLCSLSQKAPNGRANA
ncbi:hypothetical protein KUCAC02_012180, partial [Chaenocephalus aceratus]